MKDFFSESDCDLFSHRIENSNYKLNNLGISLEKANHLLRLSGKVVYGCGTFWSDYQSEEDKRCDTHTALLINIEPIKKDSAEKILRDLVDSEKQFGGQQMMFGVIERAKKLLEQK